MASVLNLLLEQRMILLLLGFAVLLLVAALGLVLAANLRRRARKRARQRALQAKAERLALETQLQAQVEEASEMLSIAKAAAAAAAPPPAPKPEPPAAKPAEAAKPADAAKPAEGDKDKAPPKPQIAMNLFGSSKAIGQKQPEDKSAGGAAEPAFGDLFAGVFDDEISARLNMMLSDAKPVTMAELAKLSQQIRENLGGELPAGDEGKS